MKSLFPEKQDITIVGGGCSGSLLLLQLIKKSTQPISVTIINSRHPFVRGIAYQTEHEEHLLNVRAGRMSAFPDEPMHFVNWLLSKPEYKERFGEQTEERFIPRIIYGNYLEELVFTAVKNKSVDFQFHQLNDEVTDLIPENNCYKVELKSGQFYYTEKVALCTGNHAPTKIPGLKNDINDSRIYINPWAPECLKNIDPHQPILIIGTSLTMADIVMTLSHHQFQGKIYAISRHGELPNEHPEVRSHFQREEPFIPANGIENLYRQVKHRIREIIEKGYWQEPVLEDIRPFTQQLWQQFSLIEKQRFLRHLNHKWSKIRHRLPTEVFHKLKSLIQQQQLELIAGEIEFISANSKNLEVTYLLRKDQTPQIISVQRIINCVGPEGNITKSDLPLPHQLMRRGLIRPCEMFLGYDATPEGQLLNLTGAVSENLWTMGPGLRGVLWESTAVPEIRVQAKQLAEKLLF